MLLKGKILVLLLSLKLPQFTRRRVWCVTQCYSKRGLCAGSVSITWELIGNANSQATILTIGGEAQESVF